MPTRSPTGKETRTLLTVRTLTGRGRACAGAGGGTLPSLTPVSARPRPLSSAYWVEPGPLLAGGHPGRHVAALVDVGVTDVFDLTVEGEYGLPSYVRPLHEEAERRGRTVRYRNVPIVDMGCPAQGELGRLLDELDAVVAAGGLPYVHCHGG